MDELTAHATWTGDVEKGSGTVALQTGIWSGPYSARLPRDGSESNPEELLAAAYASCYNLTLSAVLGRAGHPPDALTSDAVVHLRRTPLFEIERIELTTRAEMSDLSAEDFDKYVEAAKQMCPVSKALAGVETRLDAKLATSRS